MNYRGGFSFWERDGVEFPWLTCYVGHVMAICKEMVSAFSGNANVKGYDVDNKTLDCVRSFLYGITIRCHGYEKFATISIECYALVTMTTIFSHV
jgi:hypothetical protein